MDQAREAKKEKYRRGLASSPSPSNPRTSNPGTSSPSTSNPGRSKKSGTRSTGRLLFRPVVWLLLLLAVLLAGSRLWLRPTRVAYGPGVLAMTPVVAQLNAETLSIPVEVVREKKLVSFEYKKGDKTIPLLAYLAPDGRPVVAVRLCEPCSSTTFFIAKGTLVCGVCGTRWDLQSLKGISGGCINYPPARLAARESKDQLLIAEETILTWQPRQ